MTMNKSQCAIAMTAALLGIVPALSQAEVDNQPDGDYLVTDLTQDGTLAGDPDEGAGPGDDMGVLDFKICDSRSGETGRRISISRSGSMITREVQCG